MRNKFTTLVLAGSPGLAMASDPTPLFELFIAWPLLAMALICFGLVLSRTRNALSINLVLLLFLAPVTWWAYDAEYLKADKVNWFWWAIVINLAAIGLWWYRHLAVHKE